MPRITATLVTHNEEARIATAMRSVKWADEILVVDDGSTDRTREIAADLGARVVIRPWDGFIKQKNFADQAATHDWILNLDADEELDVLAQEAVLKVQAEAQPAVAGYRFRRLAQFMGRWIWHSGWYPDYKVRLYDRRFACRVGGLVHEGIQVEGRPGTLPGAILHYTHETAESLRAQLARAAATMGQEMWDKGQRPPWLKRRFSSHWRWITCYLVRGGFLDGKPGWVIAREESRYVAQKMKKWEEAARAGHLPPVSPAQRAA